jgi:hypothetical protein
MGIAIGHKARRSLGAISILCIYSFLNKNKFSTVGYGRAYQEPLPTPCRAICRFSTSLRKRSFNVLRLVLVMRIASLMLPLLEDAQKECQTRARTGAGGCLIRAEPVAAQPRHHYRLFALLDPLLRVAATGIGQVVGDELAQPEPFIQLSNQQQASIGGDS